MKAEAASRVGGEGEVDPAPGEEEVRVMAFHLSERADLVDDGTSLARSGSPFSS
jgi:hypothetical protein